MNAISCDEAQLLVSEFLADDATASESEQIESHLEQCDRCRQQAAVYCRLDRALTEIGTSWRLPAMLEIISANAPGHVPTAQAKGRDTWFPRIVSRIAAALLIASISAAGTYAAPKLRDMLVAEKIQLINPGFEDGLNGWEQIVSPDRNDEMPVEEQKEIARGKSKVRAEQFHNGKSALELQYGFLGGGVEQEVARPIPHGAQVKLSAWVLMPVEGSRVNKILSFSIQGFDPDRKELWTAASFHDVSFLGPYPKWTRLEFTPGNLAPTDKFTILITTGNGDGNGPAHSVFVDDVEVTVLKR
jgi:hypothetical protein